MDIRVGLPLFTWNPDGLLVNSETLCYHVLCKLVFVSADCSFSIYSCKGINVAFRGRRVTNERAYLRKFEVAKIFCMNLSILWTLSRSKVAEFNVCFLCHCPCIWSGFNF